MEEHRPTTPPRQTAKLTYGTPSKKSSEERDLQSLSDYRDKKLAQRDSIIEELEVIERIIQKDARLEDENRRLKDELEKRKLEDELQKVKEAKEVKAKRQPSPYITRPHTTSYYDKGRPGRGRPRDSDYDHYSDGTRSEKY